MLESGFCLLAQIVGPETVEVDWFEQLRQGGFVVVIQGLLVVALIAISLERFFSLKRDNFAPAGYLSELLVSLEPGVTGSAESADEASADHTLARVVQFVLEHGTRAKGIAESVRDLAQREIEVQHEKLASIALIAAVAPLLGLLGTMIGMIESFQLVSIYGDDGGASMLAGSIAKALITTAVGLIIALPALFIHHFLKRRLQRITKWLEMDLERLQREWLLSEELPAENLTDDAPEN